jgi:5-methylcytosine-specific restriction endonuclease McrA
MINCAHCGVQFSPVSFKRSGGKETKYCSKQCNANAWYAKKSGGKVIEKRTCVHCKKEFVNHATVRNQKTCSPECSKKQTYISHKEKRIAYNQEWARNNRDKTRVYHRKHYAKNSIELATKKRLRRVKISLEQWEMICNSYQNKCVQCEVELPANKLTIDHIIPHSLGGTHEINNLQPMCMRCNVLKGNRYIGLIPENIFNKKVEKNDNS